MLHTWDRQKVLYRANILKKTKVWWKIAIHSFVGETIHLKGYMGNSYGFKIPRDGVARFLPLAAIADIAEPALVAARDHEGNIEESKKIIWYDLPNYDNYTLKSHSDTHGWLLNHVKKNF